MYQLLFDEGFHLLEDVIVFVLSPGKDPYIAACLTVWMSCGFPFLPLWTQGLMHAAGCHSSVIEVWETKEKQDATPTGCSQEASLNFQTNHKLRHIEAPRTLLDSKLRLLEFVNVCRNISNCLFPYLFIYKYFEKERLIPTI
ncbi:hypothetical protein CHARACLAT_015208 [Characodon lateralis]|uniref:Uncharacterized protein n=1 Tax=Characodon lateralis TaxID=208331 RepID=A0ABU7DGU0_9TELE|nr:hypothetical protein [Characodon lateralis]